MAKQVRPGLINPCGANGPQESAEVIRNQPAYSIRARDLASHSQAGCMAAISSCEPELKKNAWQLGASMYGLETFSPGGRAGNDMAKATWNIANRLMRWDTPAGWLSTAW